MPQSHTQKDILALESKSEDDVRASRNSPIMFTTTHYPTLMFAHIKNIIHRPSVLNPVTVACCVFHYSVIFLICQETKFDSDSILSLKKIATCKIMFNVSRFQSIIA